MAPSGVNAADRSQARSTPYRRTTVKNRVFVTCMGELYSLTRANYRRYLKEVALDGSANLMTHGAVLLGRAYNVTDIKKENAQTILDGGRCSWLPSLK